MIFGFDDEAGNKAAVEEVEGVEDDVGEEDVEGEEELTCGGGEGC